MNAMPPKLPPRMRIKEKYNPTPNAREKAYHLWLIDERRCSCGCGKESTVVHHPLERHPAQRWRRDHEFVVPMFWRCHNELHACGSEGRFPFQGLADWAFELRKQAIELGVLDA